MSEESSQHDSEPDPTPYASRPLCFLVPNHMLLAMAESEENDDAVRFKARSLLAQRHDISERENIPEVNMAAMAAEPVWSIPPLTVRQPNSPNRRIYDLQFCKREDAFPGVLVRSEGDAPVQRPDNPSDCGPSPADQCYDNLGIVFNFFLEVFNRNSFDGQGTPLIGIVNYDFYFPGAWWHGSDGVPAGQCIIAGNGWDYDPFHGNAPTSNIAGVFGNFSGCLDVIAHEYMHGVTRSVLPSLYPSGQSGALHEHFSDVFACMTEQWHRKQTVEETDWLIGEDLVIPGWKGTALRSLSKPGKAYDYGSIGQDKQVYHFRDFYKTTADSGGVQIFSGIPNHAFYLIAMKLGGFSWDRAGKIWYAALTSGRVKEFCTFWLWANLTVTVAGEIFGNIVASDVREAWVAVGVLK